MEIGLNKIRWLFLKIQFLSKPKWKWLKNKANKKTIRNFRKICNIFCMLRLWIPYKQHLIIPVNDRPKQSRKKIKDNLFANRICVMCIYRRAKSYMDTEQYEDAVRDYESVFKTDRSNREYR